VTTTDDSPARGSRGPHSDRITAARMAVSRHAATLFWHDGVAATSGDDIAAAAGLSTRTVWRYFRSKESCVEPVLAESAYRFVTALEDWRLEQSLEEFLLDDYLTRPPAEETLADDILAMRMIVLAADEPAIRTAWLMVCDAAEQEFAGIVARRLGLATDDPRVAVCAAAAAAATRVVNEQISVAALRGGEAMTAERVAHSLADAIRQSTGDTGFADARGR
jgi:AcrR family transcriptional regulator